MNDEGARIPECGCRTGLADYGPVGVAPRTWGAQPWSPALVLSASNALQLADTVYPVHAMGYNWLQPNADSARSTAQRIEKLIARYAELGKAQGVDCDHVLLVTHSMGGIVTRAMVHPQMGGLAPSMLGGVAFTVMPTCGAGTTYKRLRAGMTGEGGLLDFHFVNPVLGADAKNTVAVVANASGPLELYPAGDYGDDWLRVRWTDAAGQDHEQSLDVDRAITDAGCWWRAVNPEWVNPAGKHQKKSSFDASMGRMQNARDFHLRLREAGVISNSYAVYTDDKARQTWGRGVEGYRFTSCPGESRSL